MIIFPLSVRMVAALALLSAAPALARSKTDGGGVPALDVKGSCLDAQKFSAQGNDKDVAYKGCMQDEMSAKDTLAKRWSTFKPKDKQTCVEQARAPSPSYVEVLTCLEMNSGGMSGGGRSSPQIGGQPAQGLKAPAAK